jgi:hypothetical protein
MKVLKITPSNPVTKSAIALQKGEVFQRAGIGDQIFLEFKRGARSFVTQSVAFPDKKYRISHPFDMQVVVVGKAEFEKEVSEIEKLRKSPKGTLFVIANRKSAELFRLKGFSPSGKILAENPLNGNGFTIAPGFTVKLVSSIGDVFNI